MNAGTLTVAVQGDFSAFLAQMSKLQQAAEAERIIQGIITLVGSAVAFYGRLRASSKVTLMPGGK